MKRYFIFAGADYSGCGVRDLCADADTQEEAEAIVSAQLRWSGDWAQILDTATGQFVEFDRENPRGGKVEMAL